MSDKAALGPVESGGLGVSAASDRKVGAIPVQTNNPRKASRVRFLLKATLVMLAGVILALALIDPSLAKGDLTLQVPHGKSVAAR